MINNLCGRLPPKIILKLKPWDLLHIDLIDLYINAIRQHHPVGSIINNYFSINYMKIVSPDMGWFEIFKFLTFNLDYLMIRNDEYIDN